MIDFTKKELEAIKRALITHDFRYPDLMNKTQSMIDNYCEHEYSPTEALNVPLHCLKCGLKFE